MVLAGDALGFIDPVYSTGVFLALQSGEMAADTINEGFQKGDLSGKQLGKFGPAFATGMEAMRKLVYAFYTPGFSFANFVRQHPEHRDRLVDLLIGNVFKEGVTDIFDDMKAFCDLPQEMPLEGVRVDVGRRRPLLPSLCRVGISASTRKLPAQSFSHRVRAALCLCECGRIDDARTILNAALDFDWRAARRWGDRHDTEKCFAALLMNLAARGESKEFVSLWKRAVTPRCAHLAS